MKVKLLTARATAEGAQQIGDVIDLSEREAIALIKAEQAVPLRETRAPEKATRRKKKATEKAAR